MTDDRGNVVLVRINHPMRPWGSIVPLNRPALTVGTSARSVQQARHWVAETIRELGRPELLETTELGVSELVTNAVLHADPPIEVRVRGTRLHPRVEVSDNSPEPPVMPTPSQTETDPADLDEKLLLVTYGRGLDIVSRCSDAWGAEIEDAGKTMWFTPAAETQRDGRHRHPDRTGQAHPAHAAPRRPLVPAARRPPDQPRRLPAPLPGAAARGAAAGAGPRAGLPPRQDPLRPVRLDAARAARRPRHPPAPAPVPTARST